MHIDLHNHTNYCNHATGTMLEYIEKAKTIGIDIFGFSCHAPMNFDKKYRMDFNTLPIYFDDIAKLQQQSKNINKHYNDVVSSNQKSHQRVIEILSGLEVDYIMGKEYLLSNEVLEAKVDYLIGSVHFLGDWGFDNPEFIGEWKTRDIIKTWNHYLDSIQYMAKTRYFQIVGHLDLPKVFGNQMPLELFPKMEETLQILYDNNMVLEINAAGLRKAIKEPYPNYTILQKAKEIGLDITFGSDAHSVMQVGSGYEQCRDLAKNIGFTQVAIFRNKRKFLVNID